MIHLSKIVYTAEDNSETCATIDSTREYLPIDQVTKQVDECSFEQIICQHIAFQNLASAHHFSSFRNV